MWRDDERWAGVVRAFACSIGTANFDYTMTGGGPSIQSLHFKDITQSSSIIIAPLTTDAPPSNGQLKVNITGFLKLFITQIHPPNAKPNSAKNQIDALIIGVDHLCGFWPEVAMGIPR